MASTLCAWHIRCIRNWPPPHQAGTKSSLVSAALLFWWPVVSPFPIGLGQPLWSPFRFISLDDLVNTAYRPRSRFPTRFYPTYAQVPVFCGNRVSLCGSGLS